MLRAIEITNFKGVSNTIRIPIRPITLLFGANSAGKSTILHALQYAFEVLIHQNLNADITERGGHALNLGGFQNLVYNRDLSSKVTIAFELDLSNTEDIPYFFPERISSNGDAPDGDLSSHIESAKITFIIGWHNLDQRPQVTEYSVEVNGQYAASLHQDIGRKEVILKYDAKHPLALLLWDKELIESYDVWEDIQIANLQTAIPQWGKVLEYAKKPEVQYLDGGEYAISQILVGIGELFVDYLKHLRHIGPIREIIPRHYEAVTSSFEGRWFEGRAAWDYLLTQATHGEIERINDWMLNKLGVGCQLALSNYQEKHPLQDNSSYSGTLNGFNDRFKSIILHDPVKNQNFRFYDVGVGLSQLLPVLIASLLRSTKILAVEQPELHVHPSIQVGLGDLFASQIKERDCLFLIETHSEHLILRLLRRIRETTTQTLPKEVPPLTQDDVAVVYVENSDNGLKISSLRIDSEGNFIDLWPKGFFDERIKEIF